MSSSEFKCVSTLSTNLFNERRREGEGERESEWEEKGIAKNRLLYALQALICMHHSINGTIVQLYVNNFAKCNHLITLFLD